MSTATESSLKVGTLDGALPDQPRVFLMTESLQMGGTERQFAIAARSLAGEFNVKLGCATRRGQLLDLVGAISEFDTGDSMISRKAWLAGKELTRFLRQEKIQIAHSFDYYSNVLLIPAALAAGVPVIVGSHRGIGNVFSGPQQFAQAIIFHLADRIVCNCNAAADRLALYGLPRRKLAVIPNFLPNAVFADLPPVLPKKSGVLRVGMVGRMNHAVKNYPLLLRGIARLAPRYPNLETILVGDGPLRAEFEDIARNLGIADRVFFLGDRRDIPAILRSLDIFVLTSDSEGLSNAILEAMAAGLPIIATRVGGNVELVEEGKTGLLFPVGSDDALAVALEALLTDQVARLRMGSEARLQALAKYQITSVLEQFRQLYVSLLRAKGIA